MSTHPVITAQAHRIGTGFEAMGWREPAAVLDPFLLVDHFRMRDAVFAPHPHAGLSAVTYLFEDSPGGLVARDSLGGEHEILPGGLHWTLAGAGVMHDEYPLEPGLEAQGLQIFVNLPAEQKLRAPQVQRLVPTQMPQRHGAGWRAVEVFGPGHAGLSLPWPVSLQVVDLTPGAAYELHAPIGEQGLALVLNGAGAVDGHALTAGQAWRLDDASHARWVGSSPSRLAVLCGRPLREPLVRHGPFAMSDEGQVVAALQRFQTGGMGRLAPRVTATPFPNA